MRIFKINALALRARPLRTGAAAVFLLGMTVQTLCSHAVADSFHALSDPAARGVRRPTSLYAGSEPILLAENQAGSAARQMDTFKKKAEDIDRHSEKSREKVGDFSRREDQVLDELNQIEQALNVLNRKVIRLEREQAKLEQQILETQRAAAELRKQMQAGQEIAAKRLVALYKLNRLGRLNVLASAESIHEFFQRRMALERILAYDDAVRRRLETAQARLDSLVQELAAARAEKQARSVEIQDQMRQISQKKSTRSRLLASIQQKRTMELALIKALQRSAEELNQKIDSLSQETAVSAKADTRSDRPFSDFKGLLNMPVKGKIVSFFGPSKNPKVNVVNFRSGIDIQADEGEPIRAVFKGKVIYSDWFKGYGNMLIIDHGEHYYTVYAHLEEVFKSKGDTVGIDEVVATVADSGSLSGPVLYFEVRYHGKPLDPLQWIHAG
jgi:septal ring factor EnvC (AmiA/AmiB activator)